MYLLIIRRFTVITTPLKSLEFISQTPLRSLRLLSSSSKNNRNTVIAFFENHGFSKSQISVILKKLPRLNSARPEKTLLPKLLFLQSKGISSTEVANLVSIVPRILTRSLNGRIIPSFDYFRELFQSEEKAVVVTKRYMALLFVNLRSSVRPNIEILRENGVPLSNIQTTLRLYPRMFSSRHFRFKETVEEVKEMGSNPLRLTFVVAVNVLLSMSKSTWERKFEVYRKWGLPEEQVLSAFVRHPGCMMASEHKINGVMDYFVNKMGCESSFVARNPSILTHSLKSRIVPRGSVYLFLSSKGLIEEDVRLRLFNTNQRWFLDKYIKPHEKHSPGLLKLFEGELDVSHNNEV